MPLESLDLNDIGISFSRDLLLWCKELSREESGRRPTPRPRLDAEVARSARAPAPTCQSAGARGRHGDVARARARAGDEEPGGPEAAAAAARTRPSAWSPRCITVVSCTMAAENLFNGLTNFNWNEVLMETVNVLQHGQVVAVPTDTIYGITCLAQNSEAIQRIYEIKGRTADKPLAISVGNVEAIYKYCKVTVSDQVLRDLLPGPVTLVFKRSDDLNKDLNPFTDLVGVRIPKHPFMQKLAQLCGEPLALTSANVSSHTSTLTPEEFKDIWPLLGLVVDGGPIGDMTDPECRLGSTVVNLATPGKYSIIRPGCAFTATVETLQKEHGLCLQYEN
ncbi:threonylcarbamoyl-AMP synthase isoform X2 [Narcine bancroftii]|uniref:threonylcarbamoyl-AMP synthase isoform X2 n=1 Tax=Narcine bancroftii TaxID=1343680 RepID=UPI003831D3E8